MNPPDSAVATTAANADNHPSSAHRMPAEINQRLDRLDTRLQALRDDIRQADERIRARLGHLDDSDQELGNRVTETYTWLGEVDALYRDLAGQSAEFGKQIRGLSQSIQALDAATGLQHAEYGAALAELRERGDRLAAAARESGLDLKRQVRDNAAAIESLSARLLDRIAELAGATRQRDDALAGQLDDARRQLDAQQARLLQMQAVDQALQKRALALEDSSREVGRRTQSLTRSSNDLKRHLQDLATGLTDLQHRAERNEDRIEQVKDQAVDTAAGLSALRRLQRRRQFVLATSVVLLALAVAALFFYERSMRRIEAAIDGRLQSNVVQLTQHLRGTTSGLSSLTERVDGLDQRMDRVQQQGETLQAGVLRTTERLQRQDAALADQGDSLDARLSQLAPGRDFGADNLVHGPQWLAQQSPHAYLIHLASVTDKSRLYELARRYGRNTQQTFAYATFEHGGRRFFALFQGPFASRQAAEAARWRMPMLIEGRRPAVGSVAWAQGFGASG